MEIVHLNLLFLLFILVTVCRFSAATDPKLVVPERREVHADGKIFDITHRVTEESPSYGSNEGIGQFIWALERMKNGSIANFSQLKFSSVHTGTHVDAPGHFLDHYFDAGFDVDSLDLQVLNGCYT